MDMIISLLLFALVSTALASPLECDYWSENGQFIDDYAGFAKCSFSKIKQAELFNYT